MLLLVGVSMPRTCLIKWVKGGKFTYSRKR